MGSRTSSPLAYASVWTSGERPSFASVWFKDLTFESNLSIGAVRVGIPAWSLIQSAVPPILSVPCCPSGVPTLKPTTIDSVESEMVLYGDLIDTQRGDVRCSRSFITARASQHRRVRRSAGHPEDGRRMCLAPRRMIDVSAEAKSLFSRLGGWRANACSKWRKSNRSMYIAVQ